VKNKPSRGAGCRIRTVVLFLMLWLGLVPLRVGVPTQKGSTNLVSHVVRLDYALLPNLQLTAKAYVENVLDRRISNAALSGNPTSLRTQLDAILRF
jgi:hypothetical protein